MQHTGIGPLAATTPAKALAVYDRACGGLTVSLGDDGKVNLSEGAP